MWTNYLKIALRRLRRQKHYALLNMAGLSVGLAAVLVITLYIRGELSYDDFHPGAGDIFRVTYEVIDGKERNHYAAAVPALGPALSNAFADVKRSVRISRPEVHLSSGAEWHREDEFIFGDSTFFEVFGFELLRGDPSSVLSRPQTVVLTKDMARKYFGDRNPIGRSLQLDFRGERTLEVTGIVENPPENSHLSFDFLASYATFTSIIPWFNADNWLLRGSYTYIRLQPDAKASRLQTQFPAFVDRHLAQVDVPNRHKFRLHLQPIGDIHLHSHLRDELAPNGNVTYVYILGAVAVLILLISGFNYVNLSTVQAVDRRKEVGVRRSIGASRRRLTAQFLGESILVVGICGVAAVGLACLFTPVAASLTDSSYFLQLPTAIGFWSFYMLGIAALGLLAGTYPALYLSSLRPLQMFKADTPDGPTGITLRETLVTAEFGLAIILLAGTVVVYQQMAFVRALDLGFQKNELLVLPHEDALQEQYQAETVKHEFAEVTGVNRVSIASHVPTMGTPMNYQIRPVNDRQDHPVPITSYRVDEDFLPALDIELAAGRNFSSKIASDSSSFIINRAAAELFGWSSPIGRELERPNPDGPGERGRVIGLIENLHFRSLHHPIEPLILELNRESSRFVVLNLETDEIPSVLPALERRWKKLIPDRPFSYTVLSNHYEALYREEERLADMTVWFSIMALVIAGLGLYGLAAYATRRRTQEIGIRKVLGASTASIAMLLSRDFLKLVLIGFVAAAPLAYIAARKWLANFAYHVDIGPAAFIIAGLTAGTIALLAVSYQSTRAALTNPADSLRYE